MQPEGYGDLHYTLLLMDEDSRGGKDRPLTDSQGYLVWFSQISDAEYAHNLGDDGFRRHRPTPNDVAIVYDYARLFWTVTEGQADDGAVVLNGVNFMLDAVAATEFPIPASYRTTLFEFADHLTFSSDLSAFVGNRADARREIMDALSWCVGAVTIKSRFLGRSL